MIYILWFIFGFNILLGVVSFLNYLKIASKLNFAPVVSYGGKNFWIIAGIALALIFLKKG